MQATSRLELMNQRRSEARTSKKFLFTYILKPRVLIESENEEKRTLTLADFLMYTFMSLLIITPILSHVLSQQDFIRNDERETLQKLELPKPDWSYLLKVGI